MKIDYRRIIYIVTLIIVQCIFDNYVDLGPYFRFVLIPVLVLVLPYRFKTIITMLIAFVIGLIVDIFTTGVLGLNAGAMVAAAFIRQKILYSILDERNIERHDRPDFVVFGISKSLFYTISLYMVYFIAYTLLDNFGLSPIGFNLIKMGIGIAVNSAIGLYLFKIYKKE